jgi:hypothetical protein
LSLGATRLPWSRNEPPRPATPHSLWAHLSANLEERGQDASHRLLQPTSRHEHPWVTQFPSALLSPPLTFTPLRSDSRLNVLRDDGAGLPCASPASGRGALDGAPSSFGLIAHSTSPFLEGRRAPLRAALPCHGVFDRMQGWRRVPLTLPVAPRLVQVNPDDERGTRAASPARASTRVASRAQSAFHR